MCLKSQQATPHTSVSPPGAPHAGNQFWALRARGSSQEGKQEFMAGLCLPKDRELPEAACSGREATLLGR